MTFAELHHRDRPLLLPNAWDVPSALAFLDAGFEAIGTTSFGVASSNGRSDGARSTKDANVALAHELARLPCHISVDIEDGYADDPDAVAAYVARLGVAGVNLEDSTAERLIAPEAHAAKVAAVKAASPAVFVNARVDTYWLHEDEGSTLRRALAYVEAGADGVFVPGASDPDVLRELTRAIPVPVNTLPVPGLSLDELGALGVRRVSTGSLPYRAALHAAIEAATAVRDGRAVPPSSPYPELQARLVRYESTARAVPADYDDDPERFRLARSVLRRHGPADIHARVARRFVEEGRLPVLDVGCGEGELARHLPDGAWTGVDSSSEMLARAPGPSVFADATALPFEDGTFDAVALLYVLYHLREPVDALREAHRVLRPGGLLAVAAPSRDDAPELAAVFDRAPLTFDAERAPELLAGLFAGVEVERWDAPLLTLPTSDAVRDFLVGKGVARDRAAEAAEGIPVPLSVTKRGALAFARKG